MTLHKNQIQAIKAALDFKIKKLFITGEGGTGKTAVILEIVKALKLQTEYSFVLLAPTQSAADNIDGETLHSFFKIKPIINTMVEKEEDILSFNLDTVDLDGLENLIVIVDEVSMMGESILKGILARLNPKKLILLGHDEQLSPIKDKCVDWSKFCDKTITLTHNFRINDPLVKEIVSNYRARKKVIKETPRVKNIKELSFDNDTIYIAHTNKALSDMQKSLLGYSSAKVGDILLTFGACDKNISRKVLKKGKLTLVNYFNNNDLVKVQAVKQYEKHKLYFCEVIREDGVKADFNKFDAPIQVLTGDYDEYNSLLKIRFAKARDFQKAIFKKYKVTSVSAFKHSAKNRLDGRNDVEQFTRLWREYFLIKNTPYARHQNFRSVYKCQGKSFDKVVIDWNDLPAEDHKYVALSRSKSKITIIS